MKPQATQYCPTNLESKRSPAISQANRPCLIETSIVLITLSSAAGAAEPRASGEDDIKPGFQTSLSVILGASQSKPSHATTSDDNKSIDSLSSEHKEESSGIFGLGADVTYTFDNLQTQIFLTSPELPAMFGESMLELGVSHRLASDTKLSLSFIPFISGAGSEVWEDPFLTGNDRKETDQETNAFRFAAENILQLPISFEYIVGEIEIENEASGTSLLDEPGGITSNEMKLLKRAGDFYQVSLGGSVPLTDSLFLSSQISYTALDAEGEAQSFGGYGAGVKLNYMFGKYVLTGGLNYDSFEFDASHPVFDKVREDDRLSANVSFTIGEPLAFKNTHLTWFASYSEADSNIEFYDSEEAILGAIVGYSF
ncbi:DUF2860 family protein [Hahella ganghwensis]|uniref:DUF2860 family protein n=1 Tax=Hahella ganghwensis TaxID=286420 RepID=UPI00037B4BFA|nr:DUF2860 family protein [Hahella ganghwensis]